MAEAPASNETLSPDDAVDILEELLPAQNHSYELGLKFKMPQSEVEGIHSTYSKPRSRLLHIIIGFSNQTEPRPTWRVIVEALRSPAVNLPALAERLEAAHFPDLISSRDVVPETTGTHEQLIRWIQELRQKETELVQASDKAEQKPREKDGQLRSSEGETQIVRQELARKERELAEAQQQLREKEEHLRSSEALVADFRRTLQLRDQETLRLKTQPGLLATAVPQSIPAAVRPGKLTVQCRQKKTAPDGMYRGSATTDGRYAYFTPDGSTSVYQYEYDTEKWETLPSCPHHNSGLAVVDNELTAVGGLDGRRCTNKLLTLRQRKWVEEYPPMITARSRPAVVSTSDGDHLIVTGGYGGGRTAAVELLQVKTNKWYRMSNLPQPLHFPSATICGDQLNVIGSNDNGYSCSLQSLPSSDQPITSPLTLSWNPLPTLPVTRSTAATLCGQLVIIGGLRSRSQVNAIHQLVEGQWVEIGSMARERSMCLVASPSPDKLIIVGGRRGIFGLPIGIFKMGHIIDDVEECVVVTV